MFFRKILSLVCFFVCLGDFSVFARGSIQDSVAIAGQEPVILAELTSETADIGPPAYGSPPGQGPEAPLNPQAIPQERVPRSEAVMRALAAAYPDRVGQAAYRNGDWAVPVRGVWYYYAEGRLLPEELRDRAAEYDPQPFYNYPENLPPWREPGPEEAARFRDQAKQRAQHPAKRSQHFYDALWRAHTKAESYDRLKTIRVFGKPVLVHYSIMEEIALVEERILTEAKTNAQLRQWINGLNTVDTWNWRSIAATESRSYHAYGVALDLLPKSRGALETYWLWTARTKPDWWTVPYAKRLHPPEAAVKAFEAYGFIWGGKWTFYDTMHFEYRPEILILNNLPISDFR